MGAPCFDNSYARLPAVFYALAPPDASPAPRPIRLNVPLAAALGLDAQWLESEPGLGMLSGSHLPEGSYPVAMAYAGHQFGGWVPQLGDGRATLLGEVVGPSGRRYDLQLKGSGRTRFSRAGDGKATLGSVLREYIVSEAMAALGVPTTRALAALATGERVLRNGPEPGALLARVAQSHVRVGTFQYFAAQQDHASLQTLADYVTIRNYPELQTEPDRYRALFAAIAERQALLVAHWMAVGFIHGVMNTDNVQVAGETIDYGPCAFLDEFHPSKTFSSIDHHGRYAWGNQPRIAAWNLARLAEALLPLLAADEAAAVAWVESALEAFRERVGAELSRRFRAKLGLSGPAPGHDELVQATLAALAEGRVDFTLFFRELTRVAAGAPAQPLRALFNEPQSCDSWLIRWRQQLACDNRDQTLRVATMRAHNPVFIPRNHRVEEAIQSAQGGDLAPFHRLVDVLAQPYDEQPNHEELERPPASHEIVTQTFCGT